MKENSSDCCGSEHNLDHKVKKMNQINNTTCKKVKQLMMFKSQNKQYPFALTSRLPQSDFKKQAGTFHSSAFKNLNSVRKAKE